MGEHGKPFLSYRPGVHYNISHSGAYVVCVLADQEVGIDIQIHRKVNYDRMLRRMVTEKEREEILKRPDLEQEFIEHGFVLTNEKPDYVVLGFDMTLTYEKLVQACDLVRSGVPFIATHPDFNCPTETGYIPDCGAMIALITASTGVKPQVIGKPNREIIDAMFRKKPVARSQVAMVGDRLYTDIVMGHNAGVASILVLSGEAKREDIETAPVKPDYVMSGLAELHAALRQADENRQK